MATNFTIALLISVIGILLVFTTILILWAIIAMLVKLTGEKIASEQPEIDYDIERRRQAAVAAVIVALSSDIPAQQKKEFPMPPTAIVSAWQAVLRSNILNKRGPVR
jgi:hypothetical protein